MVLRHNAIAASRRVIYAFPDDGTVYQLRVDSSIQNEVTPLSPAAQVFLGCILPTNRKNMLDLECPVRYH
jgi:hypothetical protein